MQFFTTKATKKTQNQPLRNKRKERTAKKAFTAEIAVAAEMFGVQALAWLKKPVIASDSAAIFKTLDTD